MRSWRFAVESVLVRGVGRGSSAGLFVVFLLFWGVIEAYFALTNSIAPNELLPRVGVWGEYESNGLLFFLLQHWLTGAETDLTVFTCLELRGLPWLFGVLSLVAMYRLGCLWSGKRLGLCMAFGGGCHALWQASAVFCRFYSLNLLLVVLSTYYFTLAWRSNRLGNWWKYALATVGMVSSMLLSTGVVLVHMALAFCWGSGCRGRWLRAGLVWMLGILVFAGLVWRFPDSINRFDYGAFGSQGWAAITRTLGVNGYNPHCINPEVWRPCYDSAENSADRVKAHLAMALGVLTVVLFALFPRKRRMDLWARTGAGLLAGITIVVLGLALFSASARNIVLARNLTFLVPVCASLFGLGMGRRAWVRYVYLSALLLVLPLSCESLSMFGYIDRSPLKIALSRAGDIVFTDGDVVPRWPRNWGEWGHKLLYGDSGGQLVKVGGAKTAVQQFAVWAGSNQAREASRYNCRVWVITNDYRRAQSFSNVSGRIDWGGVRGRVLVGTHTYGDARYGTGDFRVYLCQLEPALPQTYGAWENRWMMPH